MADTSIATETVSSLAELVAEIAARGRPRAVARSQDG